MRWLGTPWHLGMGLYWLWVYLSFNCVQISGTAADGSPMLPALHISSGVASCLVFAVVVLLHRRIERSGRLRAAAWAGAALTALGTLLYALPLVDAFGAPARFPVVGAVVTGLASPAVALAWGVSYSRLDARRAVELVAGSFFVAAALYWLVAVMPEPWNGLLVSLAPLLSLACLSASRGSRRSEPPSVEASSVEEPLGRELRQLMLVGGQWRVMLGLFVTMLACGGLRVYLMHLDVDVFSHPVLMAAPIAAMAAVFFLYGRTVSHTSLSLGSLYRAVPPIFALAIVAVVVSDLAAPTVSFVTATAGDALIAMLTWVLLAEVSRTTHFSALLVFAAGRLAIHAGMLFGEFIGMQFRGDMTAFFLVLIVLLVCVSCMMFAGSGSQFAFEPPQEGELGAARAAASGAASPSGSSAGVPAGGRAPAGQAQAPGQAQALAGAEAQEAAMRGRFEQIAREHDLSPRETEVFLLWATGHGSRAIEDRLSVSPATVKTHLRHIYAKCDVHSRAELLELIEKAA